MGKLNLASKIAVIGGGISGLAIAVSLKLKGFERVNVFEKDVDFGERRQGYGLTILQGKRVLRELGVLQEAKKANSPTKAHYFFNQKGSLLGFYGTVFWDKQQQRSKRWSEKGLSMHIPRNQLRKILWERLKAVSGSESSITWNHKLTGLNCTPNRIELDFDSRKYEADVVIGCDGIYSNLRRLAVDDDAPLNYLGVMVGLGICESKHSLNQKRIFQSSNGFARFYSMPFHHQCQERNTMWQFSVPLQEERALRYQQNPKEAKQFMKECCRNWHEPVPTLIEQTKTEQVMSLPAYDRTFAQAKLKDERILLMGDACHPMSPFKSQGANQALIDAVTLSSLFEQHSSLAQIGPIFNKQQLQRVQPKVQQSRQRVQKYHTKAYLTQQNYLYPKIDLQLLNLINSQQVDFNSGDQIEQDITAIMKRHNYI